jgi:hypothetical protein
MRIEHITSIPKIYTAGVRQNAEIFRGPVVVEEKYDGSQFTFGLVPDGDKLSLFRCRSKSTMIDPSAPGMFKQAYDTALRLMVEGKLVTGWTYCCEFISKLKHNVLQYNRVPDGFLVLYDVRKSATEFAGPTEKHLLALDLGLEPVKNIATGEFFSFEPAWLTSDSSLGIPKVEGVVIKNYGVPHAERESWPMTAKVVNSDFKEKMACKPRNPKAEHGESVQQITSALRTEPRWLKAIQHLRDAGQLTNDCKDIGPLVREIQRDILQEESEWIKQQLFDAYSAEISRGVVNGFAQYYKDILQGGLNAWQEQQTKS